MRIAITGNKKTIEYLVTISDSIEWIITQNVTQWNDYTDIDGYFNMEDNSWIENYSGFKKPVLINSVAQTLQSQHHGQHVVRINGWNGFLERNNWEIAGDLQSGHVDILNALKKEYTSLPDEPGFIAPRILAMIINEAYFAKEQQVSTESEIDVAMKLGTNYPKGPFEWKEEIGIHNISALLEALSASDKRYHPSSLLSIEAKSV